MIKMDEQTAIKVFKKQVDSIHHLYGDNRDVAILQTLRMSLAMMSSIVNNDKLEPLFDLYDKELEFLLLNDNCHPDHSECHVEEEMFSDDEKEDSDWASGLSKVCDGDTCNRNACIFRVESKGKECAKEKIDNLFTSNKDEITIPSDNVVNDKVRQFIIELSNKDIAVSDFKKLEEVMNMYEGENESIIRSSNVFKYLFDNNYGDILLSYLK